MLKFQIFQPVPLKRLLYKEVINILEKMNVKINFITDGDIAGVLSVIGKNAKNDIYYSTGGGPEGVLAAAASHATTVKYKVD